MDGNWYAHSHKELFKELSTTESGLSTAEAKRRLKKNGPNSLPEAKPDTYLTLFTRQFRSPLIYILLGASAVVFLIGETIDGSIILAVLLFNAVVGTIQEGRAQNTLLALKRFTTTRATVIRDGKERFVPDAEVVQGDIVLIEEGQKVSADARLVSIHHLRVDESSLTGESTPVQKNVNVLPHPDVPLADRKNMVFKGTSAVAGNATAVVVAVGLETEIGRIAKVIATIDTEIPLQTDIRRLSRAIIVVVSVVTTLFVMLGLMRGAGLVEIFSTAVAIAVSVIPEGLPIVMTLVLATGVWRMSKRNALVKKLNAVEALGQARVLAVDKTGTLTKNELIVREVWTDMKLFKVEGDGYEPHGIVTLDGARVLPSDQRELMFAGRIAALNAGAHLSYIEEEKRWHVAGDPTEAAIAVFGEKAGFKQLVLDNEFPSVQEMPFDYRLRYLANVRMIDGKRFMTISGAPETIIEMSNKIFLHGRPVHLTKEHRRLIEETLFAMASRGLRVVAFAIKHDVPNDLPEYLNKEAVGAITFGGFYGIEDSVRPEAKDAVARVKKAGMRVVMITGDFKITAQAIAKEAGIYSEGDEIISGEEMDGLNDVELASRILRTTVFARVTPEHKLRIVSAYKKRGEIIAMTGDGVNDAPSLVAADLGVAMGSIGSEVAKEAADIILLDDNFASITAAVEEGRSIYITMKKVILYLFSTSFGEVLVIIGALIIGYPLSILAAQIIWLNFVTDGFLDVALAMEPKEKNLLDGIFRRTSRSLVDGFMLVRMFVMAVPMMIGTLFLFSLYADTDLTKAWTISLTTLAVFQWFNAWNCRSDKESVFSMNPFGNMYLVGATALVTGLQFAAIYTPLLQGVLRTVPLAFSDWLLIIPVAATVIAAEEARKAFVRSGVISFHSKQLKRA